MKPVSRPASRRGHLQDWSARTHRIRPYHAAYQKGRDFAAWLGLTPRETSTGGKPRPGGISKRGNKYLRTLLVHCARSALETLSKRRDRLGAWLRRQLETKKRSVVIVALAARLARIAWALLHNGERFAPQPEAAPAA